MEYLSGATGYTILKKNNKKILLISDIHDGVNYCQKNSIFIDKFLENKLDNSQILLEESINDPDLNLTELWPNAVHTTKLKILKENNNKVIPTDIRPYLIPFSWQYAESNKEFQEIKISKYLLLFKKFFNKQGIVYLNYIFPYYEYLNTFISKKDKEIIYEIFKQIKKLFDEKYNLYLDKTLKEVIEIDEEYLHSIDNIN